MRGLLMATVVLLGLGALCVLGIVFLFNFLTLRPDYKYGPELYAAMALNLLAMLAVMVLVYAVLRRLRR